VAFYGPNDTLATKVVVSVILTKNNQPDFLKRWLSEGDLDVRRDPTIGEQVLAFPKRYAPRSTVVTDRIIGCPHEEGTDYPEGFLPAVSLLGRTRPLHTRAHSLSGKITTRNFAVTWRRIAIAPAIRFWFKIVSFRSGRGSVGGRGI